MYILLSIYPRNIIPLIYNLLTKPLYQQPMNKISPINPLLPANQHQLCTLKNLCLQLLNHVVVTARGKAPCLPDAFNQELDVLDAQAGPADRPAIVSLSLKIMANLMARKVQMPGPDQRSRILGEAVAHHGQHHGQLGLHGSSLILSVQNGKPARLSIPVKISLKMCYCGLTLSVISTSVADSRALCRGLGSGAEPPSALRPWPYPAALHLTLRCRWSFYLMFRRSPWTCLERSVLLLCSRPGH